MIRPSRNGFLSSSGGMGRIVFAAPPDSTACDRRPRAFLGSTTLPILTAKTLVEAWRKFRRFSLSMVLGRKRKAPGTTVQANAVFLTLFDVDLLPPHFHTAAGMNLQRDCALSELR